MLILASSDQNNAALERVLQESGHGLSLDAVNKNGDTALICAADEPNFDAVRMLVRAGADVNIASHDGQTALMCSVEWCDYESVGLLTRAGANLEAQDNVGFTPFYPINPLPPTLSLSFSCMCHHVFSTWRQLGMTVLMRALLHSNDGNYNPPKYWKSFRYLLKRGANIRHRDKVCQSG